MELIEQEKRGKENIFMGPSKMQREREFLCIPPLCWPSNGHGVTPPGRGAGTGSTYFVIGGRILKDDKK